MAITRKKEESALTVAELKEAHGIAGELRRRHELVSRLEEVIGAAIQSQSMIDPLTAEVQELERRLDQLKEATATAEKEAADAEVARNKEAAEKRAAIETDSETYAAALREGVESNVERYKADALASVNKQVKEITEERDNLMGSIHELGARCSATSAELKKLEDEKATLEAELQGLKVQIHELRKTWDRLTPPAIPDDEGLAT